LALFHLFRVICDAGRERVKKHEIILDFITWIKNTIMKQSVTKYNYKTKKQGQFMGGTAKGRISNGRRKKTEKTGRKRGFWHLAEYANG
jgi:hypothetical protein